MCRNAYARTVRYYDAENVVMGSISFSSECKRQLSKTDILIDALIVRHANPLGILLEGFMLCFC